MRRLWKCLYVVALLAFGAVLPRQVEASGPDPFMCPGYVRPLCASITTIKCTAWYPCEFLKRCCKDEERHTRYVYYPSPE